MTGNLEMAEEGSRGPKQKNFHSHKMIMAQGSQTSKETDCL